ncbi:MAG: AEC family transporter [Clostridiaceae bacterium]|nr:AEC family transporter [Clostridiaceae bacterium]
MIVLLEVSVRIIIMIALGFLLRKLNIIDEHIQKGLSNLLLYAALPMSILASSGYKMTPDLTQAMLVMAVISVVYYAFSLLVMNKISKHVSMNDKKRRVFVTMSVFANTGFLGFPLMSALYGDKGLLLAVVYNMAYNIFMYSVGVHMLSGEVGDYKKMILNPVSMASMVAIIIFISPFQIPELINTPITEIGALTVPLSMIIVGSGLAPIPIRRILVDKSAYLVSFFRLLMWPAIMMLVMFFLPIDTKTKAIAVLMTALPCGSMNVIFSEKYNCEPEFAARTVVQSMLLMSITLPLMILACHFICSAG